MTDLLFVLILVLAGPAPAPIVISMPDRTMCEAAAAQVRRDVPGDWRHSCVPRIGAATR